MEKSIYIEVPFIKVNQPIGTLYVVSMKCSDLIDITKNDIRRIEREEGSKIDSYFGIQRKPSESRLKEISEYVKFVDATFPTSIVVAINSYDEAEDENQELQERSHNIEELDGKLKIRRTEKIAQIIDGQHRILGLKRAIEDEKSGLFGDVEKLENFELLVAIYVDMDIENQSMVFSIINKAQTKVNKSLVFDLYDLAKTRSPYRTAHNIVRVLNENDKSPLKDMIKMLGEADSKEETIAQATLVQSIVKYISKEPEKDRNRLLTKESLPDYLSKEKEQYFFREYFKENRDIEIAIVLINYFVAIKDVFEDDWKKNTILVKSTGIIAFMKFLKDIVSKEVGDKDLTEVLTKQKFFDILSKAVSLKNKFTNEFYSAGGVGQSKLYKDLKQLCYNEVLSK